MADRRGRGFDSGSSGSHAMAYGSDPVREDERQFARTLTDMLDAELAANAFDRLVLIAPPQTLGDLRSVLSKRLRNRVSKEVAKDLTRLPSERLADHISRFLLV